MMINTRIAYSLLCAQKIPDTQGTIGTTVEGTSRPTSESSSKE